MTYAGPTATLRPDRLAVRPGWAWQPKIDGVYCTALTDARGHIAHLLYRSGEPVGRTDADGLIGQYIGAPSATLLGELEAQTEASLRIRATRGYAHLHLFDCARIHDRSIASRPFAERYGWLHRWHAHVECYEPEAATAEWWRPDADGRAHDVLGRFCVPSRGALRRLPIVPLHRGNGRDLWDRFVEREGGEGVVAVRLDAPLGARGAKAKCRAWDTLDAVVVSVGTRAATLAWQGRSFVVSAAGRVRAELRPGVVVEVRSNGFHEGSSLPKHPRILRVRPERGATAAPVPPPAAR